MERQHGVAHLNAAPDLEPQTPRIHISVIDLAEGVTGVEWDVRDCGSLLLDHGRWKRLCPGQELPR